VEPDTKYLRALVLLQLELMSGRGSAREVLLAQAGFSVAEIAELLGKTYPAVAKQLSRAKQRRTGPDG
jgi:DNA-directed RNA polymerase specialized sigma24 family protein